MSAKSIKNPENKKEIALDGLMKVLDSKFLSAIAEPSRLLVLKQVIRKGTADISAIAEGLPFDRSVISRHLVQLYEVGILTREKQGRQVFYKLNPGEAIRKFRSMLNEIENAVSICCSFQKS